jgi:CRISPR-associated protein Csd1
MLLNSLRQLAFAEQLIDDPDFELRPICWLMHLDASGGLLQIEDWRIDANIGTNRKPYLHGRTASTPIQPVRTSRDCAFFLVDKAEYVFGIDPFGKRPSTKLAARFKLFQSQISACATATGDVAVTAVATFLEGAVSGIVLPRDVLPNDLFAFSFGGELVHLRPAVKEFGKRFRLMESATGSGNLRCVVTGDSLERPTVLPLIKRIPGSRSSGVVLVSHNFRAAESYGLVGGENAPIARAPGEAAATAMNRLFNPRPKNGGGELLPNRQIVLGSDTGVVYWSPTTSAQPAVNAIGQLLEVADQASVPDRYRGVWDGFDPTSDEAEPFYAATKSGTSGRVIVRDYIENNTASVLRNLAWHFKDLLNVHDNRAAVRGRGSAISIKMLLEAVAPRESDVTPNLAAALVRSTLCGSPYPTALVQKIVLREGAEVCELGSLAQARHDTRAALLKAILNRRRRVPLMHGRNTARLSLA